MSTSDEGGEPLRSPILLDPDTIRTDIRQTERAIRQRWPITPRKMKGIVERLYHIVRTRMAEVPTKEGSFSSALESDKVAVAAARVLGMLNGQNQKDDLHQGTAGSTYNTQINYDARQLLNADPEYIQYLRDKAAREDGYASPVRPLLHSGTVETGEAPATDRPGVAGSGEGP